MTTKRQTPSTAAHAANDDKEAKTRLIRLREVLDRTGLSRSSVYRLVVAGTFPASVQLTERSVAWVESEVDEWEDDKARSRAIG